MIDLSNHTQKRSLEEIIRVMGLNEKGIQKHDLEIDPNRATSAAATMLVQPMNSVRRYNTSTLTGGEWI